MIYAYASVSAAGTVSLTAAQTAGIAGLMSLKNQEIGLKVFIGGMLYNVPSQCYTPNTRFVQVGGWGIGVDPTGFIATAQSTAGQTTFAESAAALVNK